MSLHQGLLQRDELLTGGEPLVHVELSQKAAQQFLGLCQLPVVIHTNWKRLSSGTGSHMTARAMMLQRGNFRIDGPF
jgi:hypothetical protein